MARDPGNLDAQRTQYGSKTGEAGRGKEVSTRPAEMLQAGGSGDGAGPTSSPRTYPKGSSVKLNTDFNPIKDKKRGATEYAVGGVKC